VSVAPRSSSRLLLVAASQTRAVLSAPAVTIGLPSRLNRTLSTRLRVAERLRGLDRGADLGHPLGGRRGASQATQASRPRSASAWCSAWTKALSLRE